MLFNASFDPCWELVGHHKSVNNFTVPEFGA